MRTPARALVWEAWRLTRARFAVAAGIAIAGCAAILAAAGDRASGAALLVPFLVATIALVTTIDLPLGAAKFGFPFRASFARPVSTAKLVLAPMIYLGAFGAALYLVPVVVIGTLFGIAFPLGAAAVWIGVVVLALTAVSWGSKGPVTSFIGKVLVLFGTMELLRRLNPLSEFPATLAAGNWPDVLYLSFPEVAVLALLAAAAAVWALRAVEHQRHAEEPPAGSTAGPVRGLRGTSAVEWLRDAPAGLGRLRCPTTSPLRAELWLETRRRGFPVVGASVGVAGLVALLLALTHGAASGFPLLLVIGSLAVPVFAGVGVVGERRAPVARCTLTAFEASRPISTAALATARTAVPALSILAGWLIIGTSLWLSLPPLRRAVSGTFASMSGLELAGATAAAVVLFTAAVAACGALNAYFGLYRRRVAGAFLCLFLYAIVTIGAAAVGVIGFRIVLLHLWVIVAAIGAGAAFFFARAITAGVLRPAHAGAAMVAWIAFAAVWAALIWDTVARSGLMTVAAPAAAASALMPLLSFALAPWSIHRLRHT